LQPPLQLLLWPSCLFGNGIGGVGKDLSFVPAKNLVTLRLAMVKSFSIPKVAVKQRIVCSRLKSEGGFHGHIAFHACLQAKVPNGQQLDAFKLAA